MLNIKSIFNYFLLEGFSKGGIQLILLYVAIYLSKEDYAVFILLVAFEAVLLLLFPTNYVEALYTTKDHKHSKSLFSSLLYISMLIIVIYMTFVFLLQEHIFNFFHYHNIYIFFILILNSFYNSFFRFVRVYYQLDELHGHAMKLILYPFAVANLFAIILMLLLDDYIFAFFIGKFIGFSIFFIILIVKLKSKMTPFNKEILVTYLIKCKYLYLLGFILYLSGYGFLYIGKLLGDLNDVARIGYTLNIYMLFLLMMNAINQVYNPRVRKLVLENFSLAKKLSARLFTFHIIVFVVFMIISYSLIQFHPAIIENFLPVLYFSTFIYLFSAIRNVFEVYIYINDKYKEFVISLFFVELVTISCIFILSKYIDILYLFVMLFFNRMLLILYLSYLFNKKENREYHQKNI